MLFMVSRQILGKDYVSIANIVCIQTEQWSVLFWPPAPAYIRVCLNWQENRTQGSASFSQWELILEINVANKEL